jgi:hypothetical protein
MSMIAMGGMGSDREEKPTLIGPEIDVLSFLCCRLMDALKFNFGFATRRLVADAAPTVP